MFRSLVYLVAIAILVGVFCCQSVRAATDETPAQRGYRLLLEKPYLTPDFDQQVFDELWNTWEEPLKVEGEGGHA